MGFFDNITGFQITDTSGNVIDSGSGDALRNPGGPRLNTPPSALPGIGNLLQPGNAPQQGPIQGSTLNLGIQGQTISQPGGTSIPNTSFANPLGLQAAAGNAPPSNSLIAPGSLSDYFARAIIVVLGFIFVAVGLNMLRGGTPTLRAP